MTPGEKIDEILSPWVYEGAYIEGPSGSKYKVLKKDGPGWWIENQWTGASDFWLRSSILLNFKAVLPRTRFERTQ